METVIEERTRLQHNNDHVMKEIEMNQNKINEIQALLDSIQNK